jgi:hypothetical protein
MGFKGQRDFRHVGWYLHCKQAKSFVNVIQHGDGDLTCTPPIGPLSSIQGPHLGHRIKISNRRATQRCNVSSFFYAKICSLLARRRSSQPVQRVYWPENVIDWLGKWRPTCVMRHARGQKLQSFRRKWPFYMDLYSMPWEKFTFLLLFRKMLMSMRGQTPKREWRMVDVIPIAMRVVRSGMFVYIYLYFYL